MLSKSVLMGDFNFRDIDWQRGTGSTSASCDLMNNCLDLCLLDGKSLFEPAEAISPPSCTNDHVGFQFTLITKTFRIKNQKIKKWKIDKNNIGNFCNVLNNTDWNSLFCNHDSNSRASVFEQVFIQAASLCFEYRTVVIRTGKVTYPSNIKKLVKACDGAFRIYRQAEQPLEDPLKEKWKSLSKQCDRLVKKFECSKITERCVIAPK
ncbi:uncharacterized protein LOC129602186 [Paramacrobiotus metropolitanus]|uniref:uncharacterized protein LOC129602186 n=1 Tax=Paramacrobiotus metropolitanus TaxID=2943436 RepID=UPI0024459C50|nr:uncharacterized protein LOC129602186 [Paramacrobiotus metropolitanus]